MRTEKEITQEIEKCKLIQKNCINNMLDSSSEDTTGFKIYQNDEARISAVIEKLEWVLGDD